MPTQSTAGSVTVLGRMATTRGLTAYFILLLATLPLVAITARQAWVRTHLPDVGLDVDANLQVESLDKRWSNVKQRDRVVALDGVPLREPKDWVTRALSHDMQTPLSVTFERDGKSWTQEARASPIKLVDQLAVWARIATAATLMVLGLIGFVLRPGVATTWLMLLLAWDLGLFLLLKIGFYFDPRLYKESTTYPWAVATSVGLHFLCFFPKRIPWMADRPMRVLWLYVPCVVAPIVHATSAVTKISNLATLWGAFSTLLVVGIVAYQYRGIRRTNDERGRSQYRALLVGFTGGLLLPSVWNWLRLALDIWNSPWAAHYNALPLVLFVGVSTYAVVKHNALAIDRFTAAVVGYGVTTILLGAVFAAALLGIPLLLDRSGLAESPVLLVSVTALTFASFSPVYRRIKRWVDSRFFRERADADRIADALRELVLTMQTSSRDEAIRAAFDAADVLKPDRVELWLLSDDAKELRLDRREGAEAGADEELSVSGPLATALKSGATAGVDELAPRVLDQPAQAELWQKQLAMVAPLMVHGALAGFLALGRKRSGAIYELEELSLLTIVAAQLGSTLERFRTQSAKIDRYHLEQRLGTGGMAEVFLAWQVGPGGFERKVAIKRPLPHVSEEPNAVAAFLDEARLAAQLQHPNIAQVYDVGESSGSYFIVMEYVDGPSLRQVLRQLKDAKQRMPVSVAAAINLSVLAALDYAHRHSDERGRPLDLVHRDITPRNVLLNRQGRVKLVDFGIARAEFQLHVTRTGTVKGTLPYMSPEQATGKDLDRRSDLYSAGVLLYELLTSEAAFPRGPSPRRPLRASARAHDVPTSLEPVLERAMAYDASARFASAAEQGAALTAALQPITPATPQQVAGWLATVCPDDSVTDPRAAATIIASAPDNPIPEPPPDSTEERAPADPSSTNAAEDTLTVIKRDAEGR